MNAVTSSIFSLSMDSNQQIFLTMDAATMMIGIFEVSEGHLETFELFHRQAG